VSSPVERGTGWKADFSGSVQINAFVQGGQVSRAGAACVRRLAGTPVAGAAHGAGNGAGNGGMLGTHEELLPPRTVPMRRELPVASASSQQIKKRWGTPEHTQCFRAGRKTPSPESGVLLGCGSGHCRSGREGRLRGAPGVVKLGLK